MTELNRRKFLTYVGTGVGALTVASTGLGAMVPKAEVKGVEASWPIYSDSRRKYLD